MALRLDAAELTKLRNDYNSTYLRSQKVLGVTLARGGSKGVPRKNIRMVYGKPLLAWTIEEAKKCTLVNRYIVSTDDEEIATVAREYGAEVLMRPKHLAEDDTPSRLALLHALEALGEDEYNIIADIRCTNALKTSFDIDAAIAKLVATGADVVCGITRLVDHHPSRIKMLCGDRLVDVWPEPESGNRQDLRPKVYIRNGSFYIVRVAALKEGIHFNGGDVRGLEMPLEKSINIDSELDLIVTEALLKKRAQ